MLKIDFLMFDILVKTLTTVSQILSIFQGAISQKLFWFFLTMIYVVTSVAFFPFYEVSFLLRKKFYSNNFFA